MTDEILRNGVPHNVTTSLVTRNAVLPQNMFTKEEGSDRADSGIDGTTTSPVTRDPSTDFDQKPHIRDNMQALKNLAHSDNLQSLDDDEFSKNLQSLGDSRSIEDNKLYLEKKSIKSNRQLISQTSTDRSVPNLTTPNAINPSSLDSDELESRSTEFQNAEKLRQDKHKVDQDNAFQMRIKKLKGHVRTVDSSLQHLDPDK